MTVKQKLINMATPDANIHSLQTESPKLYRAIKNLGDAGKIIVGTVFPPRPSIRFSERFIIEGNPSVANDVLPYRYHVILPVDDLGFWNFTSIVLASCYITAKIQGAATDLSVDIKVQNKDVTTWNSLFKSGFNPILPKNVTSTHNIDFAIGILHQDDLLRVDVLATDGTVSGVSLDLLGDYVIEEKN